MCKINRQIYVTVNNKNKNKKQHEIKMVITDFFIIMKASCILEQ